MTGDLDRQASGGPADGGRRTVTAICEATLRHVAMATATEVGFPPLLLFFESFLEISLRSAKSRYGNRFRYTIFIDVVEGLGFQNGSRVCLQCQGNL